MAEQDWVDDDSNWEDDKANWQDDKPVKEDEWSKQHPYLAAGKKFVSDVGSRLNSIGESIANEKGWNTRAVTEDDKKQLFDQFTKNPIKNAAETVIPVRRTTDAIRNIIPVEQGYQDVKDKNYGGLAVDLGMGAGTVAGAYHGLKGMNGKAIPKVLPTEAPIEQPPAKPQLALPPAPYIVDNAGRVTRTDPAIESGLAEARKAKANETSIPESMRPETVDIFPKQSNEPVQLQNEQVPNSYKDSRIAGLNDSSVKSSAFQRELGVGNRPYIEEKGNIFSTVPKRLLPEADSVTNLRNTAPRASYLPVNSPELNEGKTVDVTPTDEGIKDFVSKNKTDDYQPYETPSAVKTGRVKLTSIENDNIPPQTVDDVTTPRPGQARPPKDINGTEAQLGYQTLQSNEFGKPVVEPILKAYDTKIQWIRATLAKMEPAVAGLNKAKRELLGQALDGQAINDPDLQQRAQLIRSVLDDVHKQANVNTPGSVGYIKDYFTHMAKDEKVGLGIKQLYESLFKRDELTDKPSEDIGDLYEKKLGDPDSPYFKKRTGELEDFDYDVRRVMPVYLEAAGKYIFDKSAVDLAQNALKNIPDSKLKNLGQWYIKNYTNYDSDVPLRNAENTIARTIATRTARSFVDWNLPLHALHLGQLPANVWPELPTKNFLQGIGKVVANPVQTWTEASKLGLIQGDLKPGAWKTGGERYQNVAYFGSAIERLVKGITYEGAKKMYLDKGMNEAQAAQNALQFTKRTTLTIDPARTQKILASESSIFGRISSKLGGQFHSIPAAAIEQWTRIAANAKANPAAAAKMVAGVTAMLAVGTKTARFVHADLSSLAKATPLGASGYAAGQELYPVSQALLALLKDQDVNKAQQIMSDNAENMAVDAVKWAVPGGNQLSNIYDTATDKAQRDKVKKSIRQSQANQLRNAFK